MQGIDYGMLKIKHLISYIRSVIQRGYTLNIKKGNNYNIYIYEKKRKKRVDPICALLKLDETHNGYNIYSGCFIMCGPSYEYEHICVCELYWFVVLVNNVSIPCKCICYKITEIVPARFFTKCKATISRNILYKIRKSTTIYHRYHRDDTLSM